MTRPARTPLIHPCPRCIANGGNPRDFHATWGAYGFRAWAGVERRAVAGYLWACKEHEPALRAAWSAANAATPPARQAPAQGVLL